MRQQLRELIERDGIVHGPVTLSSGRQSDWYADLRRITLGGGGAPLVGRVLLDLTKDMAYDAVGGLTLGADPIATAMVVVAAADGRALDGFIVRKATKQHGLQRQIEGPDVRGRDVLVVEDTSTTGDSALTAVSVLREHGANVVGVAALLDRGGGERITETGLPFRAVCTAAELGLA